MQLAIVIRLAVVHARNRSQGHQSAPSSKNRSCMPAKHIRGPDARGWVAPAKPSVRTVLGGLLNLPDTAPRTLPTTLAPIGHRVRPPTFYYLLSITPAMPQPRGFGSRRVINEPNDSSPMQSFNEPLMHIGVDTSVATGAYPHPVGPGIHDKKQEEISNSDRTVNIVCSCCIFRELGMGS